jgi:23S rRNA (pseudouridine1915-N3)-methyltransferase
MRIAVYWIGKTRLAGVASLTDEYAHRLRHYCELEAQEIRGGRRKTEGRGDGAASGLSAEEDHMISRATKEGRGQIIALDPNGRRWNSTEFAAHVGKQRDQGTRELAFCVGGADGFSEEFLRRADLKVSLSPMTMPHELARVVLLEQLYRAFTILSNHPYPR